MTDFFPLSDWPDPTEWAALERMERVCPADWSPEEYALAAKALPELMRLARFAWGIEEQITEATLIGLQPEGRA